MHIIASATRDYVISSQVYSGALT